VKLLTDKRTNRETLPLCRSFVCIVRVPTDPGKVWKVLEFNVEIFKALKSLVNDHRYGKVWKENCNVDLENTDVCNTVD